MALGLHSGEREWPFRGSHPSSMSGAIQSGIYDKCRQLRQHAASIGSSVVAAVEAYLWEIATNYMGISPADWLSKRCSETASRLIGLRPQLETH
jgi:hypothetical protein